jgi:hypothetical protein
VSVLAGFRFAWSSPKWLQNVALVLCFMVIPVAGPLALLGWGCEVFQRLARRHPHPYVDIDFGDFVHYLTRGLVPFVVGLAFQIPLFIGVYLSMAGIPIAAHLVQNGSEAAGWGVLAATAILGFFFWSYAIAVVNAAQTRAELTEDFGASFQLGRVFRYAHRTWLKHLAMMLVFVPLAIGLSLAGLVVFCVGVYFVAALLQVVALHLRWQLYEWTLVRGSEPIAIKPPQWIPSEARRAWMEQARPPAA